MSSDLEKTKQAIARVVAKAGDGQQRTGTAFYVGGSYCVTALHVVADPTKEPPSFFENIQLTFHELADHQTSAQEVEQLWDRHNDWVVLKCANPPAQVTPISPGPTPNINDDWISFGYPEIQAAGLTIKGTVSDPDARLEFKDVGIAAPRAIQLFCQEASSGRGAKLHGLSGAPCLINGCAVGILRRTLVETTQNAQLQTEIFTLAGTAYATPAKSIADWQANRGVAILPGTWAPPEIVTQDFLVILSTQERVGPGRVRLRTVAEQAHRRLANRGLAKPFPIDAVKAISAPEELENCVRALCRAKVVVFDVTKFEPAVMFLAGIRALVRRGVTLLSVGGDYALGKQLAIPFNITDANIVAHSLEQNRSSIADSVTLLTERIRRGLDQMLSPHYLDLPVYDAVRNLTEDHRGIIPSEEGVLVLCPFDEKYESFWQDNLKRALDGELATLRPNRTEAASFGVCRSFELNSPMLVTKAIFEAIRRSQSCVIDLTDWSPNVLFEFGVRLAASGERTACIVEKNWEKNWEQNVEEGLKSQCQSLIKLFVTDDFIYDSSQSWESQKAFTNAFGPEALQPSSSFLRGDLHTLVERNIDVNKEPASRPVYQELLDQAALFSRPLGNDKPVGLFPGNRDLVRREETAHFERLLAAWFYLSNRYQETEILGNKELQGACYSILNALDIYHTSRMSENWKLAVKQMKAKIGSRPTLVAEPTPNEIRNLKEDATALRNQGDFTSALSKLQQAVRLLTQLRSQTDTKAIRTELADTYGMIGGVHRREPNLAAALDAYRLGRGIEDIDKQSTYNLSNVITLSILVEGRSPSELLQDLETATGRLEAQTEGPRKDEWWAWSDLAQFYLLLNKLDQARDCYAKGLKKTGATPDEIKRHVTILEELAHKIADKAPEISNNIGVVINELKH